MGPSPGRTETSKPFGGRWSGPVFTLTHRPPDDESDPDHHFLSGDIAAAVATALAAAGGRNLLVLGADVAGQCLRAGLVDEIIIHLLPVLLGDPRAAVRRARRRGQPPDGGRLSHRPGREPALPGREVTTR
ncbi:MAG: dihydrofolate reductase family protein [Streptosporangiales bacterium]